MLIDTLQAVDSGPLTSTLRMYVNTTPSATHHISEVCAAEDSYELCDIRIADVLQVRFCDLCAPGGDPDIGWLRSMAWYFSDLVALEQSLIQGLTTRWESKKSAFGFWLAASMEAWKPLAALRLNSREGAALADVAEPILIGLMEEVRCSRPELFAFLNDPAWAARMAVAAQAIGLPGNAVPDSLVDTELPFRVLSKGRSGRESGSLTEDSDTSAGTRTVPAHMRSVAFHAYVENGRVAAASDQAHTAGLDFISGYPEPLMTASLPPLAPVPAGEYTTMGEMTSAAWMAVAVTEVTAIADRMEKELSTFHSFLDTLHHAVFEWPSAATRHNDTHRVFTAGLVAAYGRGYLPDGNILMVAPYEVLAAKLFPQTMWGPAEDSDTWDLYLEAFTLRQELPEDARVDVLAAVRATNL